MYSGCLYAIIVLCNGKEATNQKGTGDNIVGIYLNPSNEHFQESLRSKIYVDKSELIAKTNDVIRTQQKYICVSRPRRFGKSMALNMLSAYYSYGGDSGELFCGLKISSEESYETHRNKYDVLLLNMQEFLSKSSDIDEMLSLLRQRVVWDLKKAYAIDLDSEHLDWAMQDVYLYTSRPFIVLIDEWDCMFREYQQNEPAQKKYLDFLRSWLKDQPYVGLAYMTGILPIKKYGTHSALNMFSEYSMSDPGDLASFFGFTEAEVESLCREYRMSFDETQAWYDGYMFPDETGDICKNISIYSPKSVVEAMLRRSFRNYWNQTETYEALKVYIQMNYDGLKDDIITMLAGGRAEVNPAKFKNDMVTFSGKNDVLALLVHLGYLSYDFQTKTAVIPNKEVSEEYINAIEDLGWSEVIHSVDHSYQLLQSLWNLDADAVAAGISQAHQEVSILQYNDENALSYTVNLAFYAAKEFYTVIRELPAGKGFADICMIPRKMHLDKPAVVIELKWDKNVHGAIRQIKERKYVDAINDYTGQLLLVGINYNRKSKDHECMIEKMYV